MNDSRRRFIRVAGSGGVILAATALPGCAPVPAEATEPWRTAGRHGEPRRNLLSYAILAPNPHNLQPWIVDLKTPDEITLYCDLQRLLPMTDPPSRQITIGHGCFLELLSMAAAAQGLQARIEPFPDGEPGPDALDARPVARVRLSPGQPARDPLFDQVLARTTCKQPFEARAVEPAAFQALLAAARRPGVAADGTQAPEAVARLNDIMVQAWDIEQNTARTWKESVDLTRAGSAAINRHRDGISLGGPMMEMLNLFGQLSPEKGMDPGSSYFKAGLERVRAWAPATGTWVWLTTSATGRTAQLEAGRAFVRLQLKAAELGLVTQPPSQVLQEYPEMRTLQQAFERQVGQRPGEKVQMLVRVGHPKADRVPSPRRPLAAFVQA